MSIKFADLQRTVQAQSTDTGSKPTLEKGSPKQGSATYDAERQVLVIELPVEKGRAYQNDSGNWVFNYYADPKLDVGWGITLRCQASVVLSMKEKR